MGVVSRVGRVWWPLNPLHEWIEPLSVLGDAELPEELVEVISVEGKRLDILEQPTDGSHAPGVSGDSLGTPLSVAFDPEPRLHPPGELVLAMEGKDRLKATEEELGRPQHVQAGVDQSVGGAVAGSAGGEDSLHGGILRGSGWPSPRVHDKTPINVDMVGGG